MSIADVLGILLGVLGPAALAAIAWFFRQWAMDVGSKVDHLATKVEALDGKVDTATEELGQVKVVVGWPPQLHSRPWADPTARGHR